MRRRIGTLALGSATAVLLACATPAQREKGGLVPMNVSPSRLAEAHAPRRIALLVGIQRFDDPGWRPLRYPEADARALAEVLRDPSIGHFDDVRILASGATREDLRAALRSLAAAQRDERDTVVLYVSSHGTLARDEAGRLRRYLVARDTKIEDVAETGFSMDELKIAFDRMRSRRKVLILATCHSGSGKSLLPEEVQAELDGIKAGFFVRPLEEVSKASLVLAASDWGETAREDETLGNDIYTHFLVEALRLGADRNGDGAVTASEAHDYARRMTYEFTSGRQRPSAESSEVGTDPIVLGGRVSRRGKPELYGYARRLDGFTVRIDGKPLAQLPGGVAVDAGRHRVQVTKGGGPPLVDAMVRLSPGDRIDLEHLLARSGGRWEAAPRVALLSFLDGRSRAEVLGPVPGAGATLTYREWPAPRMSLRLDAVAAAGRSRLEQGPHSAPFRFSAVTAGISLPWRFTPGALGGVSLLAGPRLSALWLDRAFDLPLAPPAQSLFTVTPGVILGVDVPLGRRFSAGAEVHADWMLVRVDGVDRSVGFGEVLLGAAFRF